jgi:quinol monooxygenase YgiN
VVFGDNLERDPNMDDEVDLVVVTLIFDATDPAAVAAVLSRYVVVSRSHPGCRNIDLAASATQPGRFVVIEKWSSPELQQAHFDSPDMVTMAESCRGLLAGPPLVDLLEPISVHDLN